MQVSASPTTLSIPGLRAVITGRVIGPDDAEYDAARTVFVGGVDRRPAVIVRVADPGDVAQVLSVARETGLELAVRSGGHSGSAHGVTEGGIVLDLRDLRSLDIDADGRTAWAGAGLTAGEYSTAAGAHGLATGFGDTGSDRAGLTNGLSFVVDAVNPAVTDDAGWRAAYPKGVSAPVTLSEVPWDQSGGDQNIEAKEDGLSLNRIEDGFWDPRHRNDFYFLTTIGGDTATTFPAPRDGGGLWLLRFRNIEKPEKGASLTLLLDGSEAVGAGEPKLHNPDNMTMDGHGNVLIQEDPGNNPHVARIVAYRVKDGALGVVGRFDEARFGPAASGGPAFVTQDEESSGIIDAEAQMGPGAFFFDAQVHTANGLPDGTGPNTVQEYVENGQLLFLRVTDWDAVYDA